jgi:hypothetical protein
VDGVEILHGILKWKGVRSGVYENWYNSGYIGFTDVMGWNIGFRNIAEVHAFVSKPKGAPYRAFGPQAHNMSDEDKQRLIREYTSFDERRELIGGRLYYYASKKKEFADQREKQYQLSLSKYYAKINRARINGKSCRSKKPRR